MSTPPKKNSENRQDNDRRPHAAYKLSGMAIKMGLVIYLGIFAGQKLDARSSLEVPWFTLTGALAGVALALYIVIKDLKSL